MFGRNWRRAAVGNHWGAAMVIGQVIGQKLQSGWTVGFGLSSGRAYAVHQCPSCGNPTWFDWTQPRSEPCVARCCVNALPYPTSHAFTAHLKAGIRMTPEQEAALHGKTLGQPMPFLGSFKRTGIEIVAHRGPRWIDSISNFISAKWGSLGRLG